MKRALTPGRRAGESDSILEAKNDPASNSANKYKPEKSFLRFEDKN